MNQENEWIIENERIKMGNKWKNLTQMKQELAFEIFLAIVLVIAGIFLVTVHILLTVVMIIAGIFMGFVALGSYSAMSALEKFIGKKPGKVKKDKNSKVTDNVNEESEKSDQVKQTFWSNINGNAKGMISKAKTGLKGKEEKQEVLLEMESTVIKSTSKGRQETLNKLHNGDKLKYDDGKILHKDYQIGELNARAIEKIKRYGKTDKDIAVSKIEKRDSGKLALKVLIKLTKQTS